MKNFDKITENVLIMNSGKRTKLPFKLDGRCRGPIADRVAAGLRKAILLGKYKAGDVLPNREELAQALGVSVRASREAVAKLSEEGLVHSRPRVGCIVGNPDRRMWKGRVLGVYLETSFNSYGVATSVLALRRRFAKENYQFSILTYRIDADGCVDTAEFELELQQSVDFVVLGFDEPAITELLDRAGVPYLIGGRHRRPHPNCMPIKLPILGERAIADVVAHCREAGIRSVVQFALDGSVDEGMNLESVLRGAGIEVVTRFRKMRAESCDDRLERIERSGMECVLEEFSKVPRKLPDLIVFLDDFIAMGGLPALAFLGVRIPEDVNVITFTSRGFGPVFPRSLARLEIDSFARGDFVARQVIAFLSGECAAEDACPQCVYLRGETFP